MNKNHTDLKRLKQLSDGCAALIDQINQLLPPIDPIDVFKYAEEHNLDVVPFIVDPFIVDDTRDKTQAEIQLEIELSAKQAELRELRKKTINNPVWDGYIEPGKTASIFIDHRCLWTDDDGQKITDLKKQVVDHQIIILEGQHQGVADLSKPITKERLDHLAQRFDAKNCVTIVDWRFYGARSGEELPNDFDSELIDSTSAKVIWRLTMNDDGSTTFDFSPFGPGESFIDIEDAINDNEVSTLSL